MPTSPAGRLALLIDIPAEVTPRGWRLAERPGRDMARARSMLSTDLDVMEEVLEGYRGSLKIQLCGPWTLAATLELPRTLNVAIADPGAVADLTTSLAEGAAAYAADVTKRVPGAQLVVQFDEPSLPGVAAGEVPTASGLSRLAARRGRRRCGTGWPRSSPAPAKLHDRPLLRFEAVPFGLFRAAGAAVSSFDLSQLRRGEEDGVAEAAEAGQGLLIGAVAPAVPAAAQPADRPAPGIRTGAVAPATAAPGPARPPNGSSGCGSGWGCRWTRCPQQAVITPACGLAGASPRASARRVDALPGGGEHAG